MKAETRRRKTPAVEPETTKVILWLKNEAGRSGVPVLKSFERWVDAVPELRERPVWTELNILIVGTAAGRRYNRQFRDSDHATNVLSFPYEPAPGEHSGLLGDIVICAPVVLREARKHRRAPRDHFAHLTIHGVLHLLGYDHEDDADAKAMETLEQSILADLGIDDPYAIED